MRIRNDILKSIKTRVHMARSSGGDNKITLTVEDMASSLVIMEIKIDAEQFLDIMSNRYARDLPTEFYPAQEIGKKLEVFRHWVDVSDLEYREVHEGLEAICLRAEKDCPGYEADRSDFSSHNYKNHKYEIVMRRYVEVK